MIRVIAILEKCQGEKRKPLNDNYYRSNSIVKKYVSVSLPFLNTKSFCYWIMIVRITMHQNKEGNLCGR